MPDRTCYNLTIELDGITCGPVAGVLRPGWFSTSGRTCCFRGGGSVTKLVRPISGNAR
jgi:hypothetical protein